MNNSPLSIPIKEVKHQKAKIPSHVWTVLTNRCPHCREGKLFVNDNAYHFKGNLKMHENCPVCKQTQKLK